METATIVKSKNLIGRIVHLIKYNINNWQLIIRENRQIKILLFTDRTLALKEYNKIKI